MQTIKEFPAYKVTKDGRIWSTIRKKFLSLCKKNTGYLFVGMRNNNKSFARHVHRLVAKAFIPNPDNKPCVNHIDGNKLNNHISNLEWCTQQENVKASFEAGNFHKNKVIEEVCRKAIPKNNRDKVLFKILRKNYYNMSNAARRLCLSRERIRQIVNKYAIILI